MTLVTAFQIVFAGGIVLASAALAGAGFRLVGRLMLAAFTTVVGLAAVAAWAAFAFRQDRELAIAGGGLTGAAIAAASSLALARALRRAARIDGELERALARLADVIQRESKRQAGELERLLARTRADAISQLAEQERRIAEERRVLILERERAAGAELLDALTRTQKQVEQRLHDWTRDLERSAEAGRTRLIELGQRQKQLMVGAEARVAVDSERLVAETEEQREAIGRLRGEIQRGIEETLAAAQAELETHAAERRRALHELGDRLRRREREMGEQIEREEAEATQRIKAGMEDVQRRQIEQLERSVSRASAGFSDEAAQRFSSLIKSAQEDAARRLTRELERAVGAFAREAETLLSEKLSHVGDAGAHRLERRLSQIATGLERQREEFVEVLGVRLAEAEADLRRRLSELASDAEADRAILEARLQELARRIDETSSLRTG